MSDEERRDKKSRILHPGEYQNASERYFYKYKNMMDKRVAVYSWRLISTDTTPQGKRKDKIKDIEKKLCCGVWHDDMNVYELVERYLLTNHGVKLGTLSDCYKRGQKI